MALATKFEERSQERVRRLASSSLVETCGLSCLTLVAVALWASAVSALPATLTPATASFTLAPSETGFEVKTLDVGAIGAFPVDVVFAIDTTASMGPSISQLQVQISQIIARLQTSHADLQMGLINFRDHYGSYDSSPICLYSNIYGGPNDECLIGWVQLTADLSPTGPLVAGMQSLGADGGGDFPECNAAVLQWLAESPINFIGWRPGSFRLIVHLTDTAAHDCDFCAIRPGGCPNDVIPPGGLNGVDPGFDQRIDNGNYPADAPIVPTMNAMRSGARHAPIKLATIFARTLDSLAGPAYGNEIGTPLDPAAPPGAWRLLSQITRGDARAVDEFGLPPGGVSIVDFVEALIVDLNDTCGEVSIDVSDPSFRPWVDIGGIGVPMVIAAGVTPAFNLPFQVRITPPRGTPPGTQVFEVQTFCDGVFLASQEVTVTVLPCLPGSPDVVANSLRAWPTAAGSGWLWQSTDTGNWNLHSTIQKADIPALWMDANSLVTSVMTTSAVDLGSFPLGLYQVYGADICTLVSNP